MKHIGRVISNKRKVVVAYRVVPNEPESCIIVTTENLMAEEHDSLMKLVESDAGQDSYELAEAMARTRLPDGRIMLAAFHTTGKMVKIGTDQVEMIPNNHSSVILKDLNEMIAQQKGVSVADLAVSGGNKTEASSSNTTVEETASPVISNETVLTDEDLAAKYRSDADRLYKEAKRLREEADKLSPSKKKLSEKSA